MNSRKPKVFVASSVESLETAHSIQENLEYSAEVTVWSQGVFNLTKTTLNTLLRKIASYDFAIFVFAPDDILKMREKSFSVTRDNVIFELGLFMGELGEDRNFIVMPRDQDIHLPTDIIGMTPATYDSNRSDNNLVAALGPACTKIKREMNTVGLRSDDVIQSNSISPPVASGFSDELRMELNNMVKNQEQLLEEAFKKFERRLTNVQEVNKQTSKAPISRIANEITERLSPLAKATMYNIRKLHLTLKEYESLIKIPEMYEPLEELRDANLLVPLSGLDNNFKRVPVFWFHPAYSKIILAILEEIKIGSDENKIVKNALKLVGYKDE